MTTDRIEQAARALCILDCSWHAAATDDDKQSFAAAHWQDYISEAKTALRAFAPLIAEAWADGRASSHILPPEEPQNYAARIIAEYTRDTP